MESVTSVSRVLADASAVFGCSLPHRRMFAQSVEAKFSAAYMHQWIFVFEDDACFPYAASDVRVLITTLLESVGKYDDVIWFGATNRKMSLANMCITAAAMILFEFALLAVRTEVLLVPSERHVYKSWRGIGRWVVP